MMTVGDLPIGIGEGKILTNKRATILVNGIVYENSEKNLVATVGNKKMSFHHNTKVLWWKAKNNGKG